MYLAGQSHGCSLRFCRWVLRLEGEKSRKRAGLYIFQAHYALPEQIMNAASSEVMEISHSKTNCARHLISTSHIFSIC